ncbi:hypothetical protein ACWGJ2_31970 [Streptomyces sp. NPDC054796]
MAGKVRGARGRRIRGWAGVLAAVALATAVVPGAVAATGGGPPDPAPGGPQRPYEPDVPGPRNVDGLAVEVTPDGGTPKGVRAAFDRTSRAEPAGPPAAARRFVFLFDASLDVHPEDFPVCGRAVVEREGTGGCPEGSVVGRGASHLYPEGTAEVVAVNTRYADGTRGALVVIPASGAILELTWERVTRPYRERGYHWALDEIVPPDGRPPQERVGTRRFQLEWGASRVADGDGDGNGGGDGGERASFLTRRGPEGERLRFGLWSLFVTGQIALPEARATWTEPENGAMSVGGATMWSRSPSEAGRVR